MMQILKVPAEFHGLRFDLVISKLLPEYSRSQLVQWIKDKRISVNDQNLSPKEKVFFDDTIQVYIDPESLETKVLHSLPEPIPITIIYEDSDLLVINKQAGLVVHPGAGVPNGTLLNALLYHNESLMALPRAGIIHRLDKDTTGLMIVAKTLEAHAFLVKKMQDREIHRAYVALVHGEIKHGGEINTYFGRHPTNRLKMAVRKAGKIAITHYSIREAFHHFTLVNLRLVTGRTHQIRVHMNSIHHSLVGDPLYGKKLVFVKDMDVELRSTLSSFRRQALHAENLTFPHPKTQKLLTFHADIPQDFDYLLATLRGSSLRGS